MIMATRYSVPQSLAQPYDYPMADPNQPLYRSP